MPSLRDVAAYLDTRLAIDTIGDYPNAVNGLQLANDRDVACVATAVDFSTAAIDGAVADGANLLIVHHGMFWGGIEPIVGRRYAQIRALVANGIAVYSAHLPLDVHPELGNNALLARRLALQPNGGFARHQNIDIGLSGDDTVETAELAARAQRFAQEHGGAVVTTPIAAGRITRRWGMCTGAGASTTTLREAIARAIDTLIVGEGPHHTAVEARDADIAVIYAGHYATETLGVQALGEDVARHFGIRSSFIPAPTGL